VVQHGNVHRDRRNGECYPVLFDQSQGFLHIKPGEHDHGNAKMKGDGLVCHDTGDAG